MSVRQSRLKHQKLVDQIRRVNKRLGLKGDCWLEIKDLTDSLGVTRKEFVIRSDYAKNWSFA